MDNFAFIFVISLNVIVGLMLLRLLLRLLGFRRECKTCHTEVLSGDFSLCRECGNVFYAGEKIGRDGMTDSQRQHAYAARGGYQPLRLNTKKSSPEPPKLRKTRI